MKIKTKINGEDVEVELVLKGRDTKKVMKLFSTLTDGEDTESKKDSFAYFELLESLLIDRTNLTEEQVDDMDAEDKNKLLNEIQKISLATIDFLKSSLK